MLQKILNSPNNLCFYFFRTLRFSLNYCCLKVRNRLQRNFAIGMNPRVLSLHAFKAAKPNAMIEIGASLILYHHAEIMAVDHGNIRIGNNCIIGNNFKLYCRDQVTLGDHVLISWNVSISDYDGHSIDPEERLSEIDHIQRNFFPNFIKPALTKAVVAYKESYQTKPVSIGDNVWIGANVTILKGVTVGAGSVIAAGSVVTKDVPPYCVAAGNPAIVVKAIKNN